MKTDLLRIVAPHFVAGVILDQETRRVTETAPIVRYMRSWSLRRVVDYAARKAWKASPVSMPGAAPGLEQRQ